MAVRAVIYGVLVRPRETMTRLSEDMAAQEALLPYAVLLVAILSTVGILYPPHASPFWALNFKVFFAAVFGVLGWLISCSLFAGMAGLSGQPSRLGALLTTTAFATLPWLFLPSLALIRENLGIAGHIIAAMGCLLVWGWSATLFVLALQQTYRLPPERLALIVCMPLLMMLIGVAWLVGFFANLIQFLA